VLFENVYLPVKQIGSFVVWISSFLYCTLYL